MKRIINLAFFLTTFVVLTVAGVGISQAMGPFSKQVISDLAGPGTGKNVVLIVVNASVYNSITTEIAQYAADIQSNGFRTVIEVVSGGKPEDLRNEMKTWLAQGLVGVVGVGDLPVPLFRIVDEPYVPGVQIFPCHLFYEDLDGEWFDTDGDGVFDVHQDGSGNRDPEIWFGVIRFSSLNSQFGSEIHLLKDYFARNHSWRISWPTYKNSQHRALVYLDDAIYDTELPETIFTPKLRPLYGTQIDPIHKPAPTTKADYLARLQENYELVALMSHASPLGQYFSEPDGILEVVDIMVRKPKPYFYDLVGCSTFDYSMCRGQCTGLGNIGAGYLAGNGLVVWGVAKGGGGFQSDNLYKFLAEGNTFGDAWYSAWYETLTISNCGQIDSFLCRHSGDYGRVLMGDPTLRLRPKIPIIQVTPLSLNFNYVPVGSTKDLFLTVRNTGDGTLTGNATTTVPFSIVSGGSYTLVPGQSQVVTIRYQPTSRGPHTGTLVLTGGYGATVQVKTEQSLGLPWLMLLLGY